MRPLLEAPDFGAIDADNDDLLLRSFEDHEAFNDLVHFKKFLIIGKKGSGKTAIFKRMINLRDFDVFTFGHTFSDYPWDHHARQARVGIPDFDKFTHSWKYLILLTISKIILNNDQSIPFDDPSMEASAKIESFVTDTYGSRDPDVTQVFTPTKRLKLKPTFEINFQLLKAGISPDAVPMDQLPMIVQEVNASLLRLTLNSLNPEHRYYICFDQLDLGFDPNNADYVSRLIGLLLACRDINLAARADGRQLLVAVFLRDDIYETLHFEDKNKLTENFVSIIEWDTPRTDKTLRQLMERRFKEVLRTSETEEVSWADVFNEEQEMPGRQTKYSHLLDRTYHRPRDMIRFVNAVLARHKQRVRDGSETSLKFENADIHAARVEYSDYFRAELDDEVHKHIPEYERYLDILRHIGGWQFDRATFERVCAERPDLCEAEPASVILEKLFRYSIIAFYRAGGRGYGGSEYVFRYREPRMRFDSTATRFRIHPGLVEVLGLKKITVQASGDIEVAEDQ